MKYIIHDKPYHYKYYFDSDTGFYMCAGILDDIGKDTVSMAKASLCRAAGTL